MAVPLLRSRAGCALHGALFTAAAIDGVTPLLHSTAGCGAQAYQLGLSGAGCGARASAGPATPSTNISEKHIVFGGTSRLREQIKNSLSVLNSELTVVLSGCPAEMIGDDVAAMVQEARDQGEAVLQIATAGFRGSAHRGYELLLNGIIAEQIAHQPTLPGLVNILGIVPQQDAFWLAEIEELSRLLAGVGLRANPLFGAEGGVHGLQALAQAELSLVLSPWGLEPARELERRFGTPWLEAGGLPVGAEASLVLLRLICEIASSADRAAADGFLAAEARREAYLLDVAAEPLYRRGGQLDFAVVAPSLHAPGLVRYLTGTLGWTPRAVVVTDDPPAESRAAIEADIGGLRYTQDAGEIADVLRGSAAEIVFGSTLERGVAAELGVPLVEVAFPTARPGLSRGVAGCRGGSALLEDILQAVPA